MVKVATQQANNPVSQKTISSFLFHVYIYENSVSIEDNVHCTFSLYCCANVRTAKHFAYNHYHDGSIIMYGLTNYIHVRSPNTQVGLRHFEDFLSPHLEKKLVKTRTRQSDHCNA